jgi:hypothetical protein
MIIPTYADMVNSNGALFHLMPMVEISVAQGIARWMQRYPGWQTSLKEIPLTGAGMPIWWAQWFPILRTLWDEMEAWAWLRYESPHSLLWGVAVLRVAYYLNTGSYALPSDAYYTSILETFTP